MFRWNVDDLNNSLFFFVGKLVNIVRQYAGKPLGAIDANQYIEIPQYYKNGYYILGAVHLWWNLHC